MEDHTEGGLCQDGECWDVGSGVVGGSGWRGLGSEADWFAFDWGCFLSL